MKKKWKFSSKHVYFPSEEKEISNPHKWLLTQKTKK